MSEYVFVGHWYNQQFMDDFRGAIESAFELLEEDLSVQYADSDVITGQILKFGIQPMIDDALFCVFDISEESRPNIFLELGYAYGKSKYVVLTGGKLPEKASDIFGYAMIKYGSFKELRDRLSNILSKIIGEARSHNKKLEITPEAQSLLDKAQTIQLLELHRASLAGDVFPLADDYSTNIQRDPRYYDYDIVFRLVRDAIQESRSQLKGFKNRKVGDIKEFVEKSFTNRDLGRILKNDIEPILQSTELDNRHKRKALIRKIKEILEEVFKCFYEKLGDDDEDDDESE